MDDLPIVVENIHVAMFADDTSLSRSTLEAHTSFPGVITSGYNVKIVCAKYFFFNLNPVWEFHNYNYVFF